MIQQSFLSDQKEIFDKKKPLLDVILQHTCESYNLTVTSSK